jgi:hypothetical protein
MLAVPLVQVPLAVVVVTEVVLFGGNELTGVKFWPSLLTSNWAVAAQVPDRVVATLPVFWRRVTVKQLVFWTQAASVDEDAVRLADPRNCPHAGWAMRTRNVSSASFSFIDPPIAQSRRSTVLACQS